jgi:hypothetical protein
MDYKVMKRPMFKMGGPTSGGTGITSGLDTPKRGLVDEPGSYAGEYEKYLGMIPGAFQKRRTGLENQMGSIGPMAALQAISGGALENVDSLGDLAQAFGNPAVLQSIMGGFGTKNKLQSSLDDVDLKEATTMATLLKPKSSGFGEKVYNMKKRDLENINKKIAEARELDPNADISALEEQKKLVFSGFDTEASIKSAIADAYFNENNTYPSADYVEKQYQKRKAALGRAEGGRINKQMGGGMDMGQEQPMQATQTTAPGPEMMKTQGEDPFQILRARLPREIPDDVVSLIAYNQKAFADFANIQDQDDVDLFNQRYNVQLVVDLASR